MEGLAQGMKMLTVLAVAALVTIPLALWKLFDIISWFAHHIKWVS